MYAGSEGNTYGRDVAPDKAAGWNTCDFIRLFVSIRMHGIRCLEETRWKTVKI